MTPIEPRRAVSFESAVHHGALDYAELERLGIDPAQVLDFSVNSNPFGPSPAVKHALEHVRPEVYPDREALRLRRALASHWEIAEEQVVIGSGTSELLALAATAYINVGDHTLELTPTYGEYTRSVRIMGGRVSYAPAEERDQFRHDPREVDATLRAMQPRIVYLCNPNNPTGAVVPLEAIRTWVEKYTETLFIIDEAYHQFVPGFQSAVALNAPNLLVMVSMTKDYALAGLRLGYAVGDPAVIEALANVRPPWNVNAAALVAGEAALADEGYLASTMRRLAEARQRFFGGLQQAGFTLIPSETHYCMVRVGDGAAFRLGLLKRGIQVRDCASFGLPAYVRVATRVPDQNERLLAAIRKMG